MNRGGRNNRKRTAELLLFTVVALRATSLLFCTVCLDAMGPLTLNAIRFTIAFVLLALIFRRKLTHLNRRTLLHGSIIGVFFFLTMAFEMVGLTMTDTSTTAFLENTSIVFVPLFEAALLRRMPKLPAVISAVMALAGVGFLTLRGGRIAFTQGELLCVATAVFYAATIISTAHFSREDDALQLGIIQIGIIGVLSIVSAFIMEKPAIPTAPAVWGGIAFLVIVCTGFGFTLQPVAQKGVSTETAGLFCAFNPLITAVLGYVFLSETFTANKLIGASLIIGSIVVSQLIDKALHSPQNSKSPKNTAAPARTA